MKSIKIPSKIELAAFDLDGTLVGENNDLYPGVKEAIDALQKRGASVLLASGREAFSMQRFANILRLNDALISLNGAVIVDASGNIQHRTSIEQTHMQAILEVLREMPTFTFVFTAEQLLASADTQELHMFKQYSHAEIKVCDTYLSFMENNAVEKLLFVADHDRLIRFREAVFKRVPQGLNADFSTSTFLEIYNANISKGAALEWICKQRGISSEHVIAAGDGENDVTMIQFAGLGIAMGTAPEHVKSVADYVTGKQEEGGLVKVLSEIMENRTE